MRLDRLVVTVGDLLPVSLAARALRLVIGDARVALCMHRVGERDGRAATCEPAVLDELVTALTATDDASTPRWLTVSFDDGYLDAVEYVRSRAPRHPGIEWLVFVCPEKAELEAGFRWDVPDAPVDWAKAAMDPAAENRQPALLAAGRNPRSRVASVQQLLALRDGTTATLGNHTNVHALQTQLSLAQAEAEYAQSIGDFVRLFGPHEHFAFPFGTPVKEVSEGHVRLIQSLSRAVVWTTERRPYHAAERGAGAPLPRFSPDGRWGAAGIALWMTVHALLWRLGLRRPAFDPQAIRSPAAAGAATASSSTGPARAAAPS